MTKSRRRQCHGGSGGTITKLFHDHLPCNYTDCCRHTVSLSKRRMIVQNHCVLLGKSHSLAATSIFIIFLFPTQPSPTSSSSPSFVAPQQLKMFICDRPSCSNSSRRKEETQNQPLRHFFSPPLPQLNSAFFRKIKTERPFCQTSNHGEPTPAQSRLSFGLTLLQAVSL